MSSPIFRKVCQKCEGMGRLDEAPEDSPYESHPGPCAYGAGEEFFTSCQTCHGSKLDCEPCNGTGEIGETECKACDGWGKMTCPECEGDGGTWDRCGKCDESLETCETVFMGDGDIICEDCGSKYLDCPECKGEGEIEVTKISVGGKDWGLVGASCSCCGARPHNPHDKDVNGYTCEDGWFCVRAQMCDSDGVFYSYLCVSPEGEGCLKFVIDEQSQVPEEKRLKLDVLKGCLRHDDDGLQSEMTE